MLIQEQNQDIYKQHTLKRKIHCAGVGLHSGTPVNMTLRPAAADEGITFIRTDITTGDNQIKASWNNVTDTRLCTVISNKDGASVSTIEHLMAAFAGCNIDNAIIEIDGPELPIMDGSAEPFVFLLDCAGYDTQNAPRKILRILKPISIIEEGKSAHLSPDDATSFAFDIDFDSAIIGQQSHEINITDNNFKNEISKARTFGFFDEIEQLRSMGLARGGTLDNAIVVKGDSVINPTGLRMKDEFVRHKTLDAIGDIYLAGMPILGRFHGIKAGHALNNQILHALFADQSAWEITTQAEAATTTYPKLAVAS